MSGVAWRFGTVAIDGAERIPTDGVRSFSGLRVRRPGAYVAGLLGVFLLHTLVASWLLIDSRFYPYVFDGNESATTAWHAENLVRLGIGATFGLADETYNEDPAAHPFCN
jgi:hypothetical protein